MGMQLSGDGSADFGDPGMQQSRAEGAEVSSGGAVSALEGPGDLRVPSWGSRGMQNLGVWEYR